MKTSLPLVLAMAATSLGAGCSQVNYCADCAHQWWTTNQAWKSRAWMYEGIACESSFKKGFKAGYRFANCGGDSCQPPGPSHFWSSGGMTEQDQRDAQAWCDGFTHGTLAAQQDGNVAASALDSQTAQPPQGVPDVYYYSNLGGPTASGGWPPPNGQSPTAANWPIANSGIQPPAYQQFPTTEAMPGGMTMPIGADPNAAGAMSSYGPPGALSSGPTAYLPPPAPPSEPMDLPQNGGGTPTTRYHGSAAFPGIGSLRTMMPAEGDVQRQPAPVPTVVAPDPAPVNQPNTTPPSHSAERAPSSLPTPAVPSAAAPQWQLPVIRD
jgi:hypothetical protein